MVLKGVGAILPRYRNGMMRWQMKIWLCLFYISMVDQTSSKDCPREKGFCVTSANNDVNSGVIKLNSKDGSSSSMQEACLRSCLAHKTATGCEVIYNQGNRGCYVHTSKSIARGNNRYNHYCWIFSKCEARYCLENGYQCHQHAVCFGHGSAARCRCSDEYEGNGTHCERFPLLTSCGGVISSPNVRIRYPGVGQYRNNEFCLWTIKINGPTVMKFTKFDLESHKTCGFDYLEMPDGRNYCGRTAPKNLISGSKNMSIIFRSNHKKFKSGFAFWIGEANCYTIGCHIYAICNTTYDVPSCQCESGYWGDGHKCKLDDECSKRRLYCHDDASCKRKKNKTYRCICKSGYKGNGTHCSREPHSSSVGKTVGIVFGVLFFVCCCTGGRSRARRNQSPPTTRTHPAPAQAPAPTSSAAPEPQPSSSSNHAETGTQTLPENSLPDNPKNAVSEISNINDPPPLYQPYVIPSYVRVPPVEIEELPLPPSYEEATRDM